MLAQRLLAVCLLISGTYGSTQWFMNFMSNCNPPETLLGKFCAGVHWNDHDSNGVINGRDYMFDLQTFNVDDDLCNIELWELENMFTCRYGYSKDFARWIYPQRDVNIDGILSLEDLTSRPAPSFTPEEYLLRRYNRFKDGYCAQEEPRTDPTDIALCAEVNTMKPEDLKC